MLIFLLPIYTLISLEKIDVEYLYSDEIESTQAYAIEYGNQLLKHPKQWTVVSAKRLTHGIGLHGDK